MATPAAAGGGASCVLSSTSLNFGQYVPSRTAPTDFTATIDLTCTAMGTAPAPVSGSIALIAPNGALTAGSRRLRYQLFLDPGRTRQWGDGIGAGGTKAISGVAGLTPYRETFTVYGRILARQSDAAVGDYSGGITVILSY